MLCIPNQIIRCLLIEIFYIIRNDHLFSQDLKWLFGTNMFTLFMLVEKNYLKYLDICPHNIWSNHVWSLQFHLYNYLKVYLYLFYSQKKPMQRFISIVLYSMTRKILRNKSFGYLSRFQMISSSWSTRNQDINPNANEWVFGTKIYAEMRKPYCKIIYYILYYDICFCFVRNITIPNLEF